MKKLPLQQPPNPTPFSSTCPKSLAQVPRYSPLPCFPNPSRAPPSIPSGIALRLGTSCTERRRRDERAGTARRGLFAAAYMGWMHARLEYLAPPLQFLTNACVVLFMVQSGDRLVLCLGCLWIKLKGIKPVPQAAAKEDVEAGAEDFPMVLVQMPMCNEREVYQQSIGAVCALNWPKSNFLVQVLDDSDDAITSALIKEEVEKWLSFLLLTAAARSVLSAQGIHFYFLLFQGVSFLVVGLDLIGEQVE